jgi:hypothetical protein
MQRTLVVIAAGLLSGSIGAFAVTRFIAPALPTAAPTSSALPTPTRSPSVVIMPPALDPELEPRILAIENELAENRSAGAGVEPAVYEDESEPTEEDRVEHYRLELAAHEQRLAAHDQEPVDPAWARQRSRSLSELLAQSSTEDARPEIVDVDCRSQTCSATLSFSSPMNGLAFIQGKNNTIPAGCNGMIATPPPPTEGQPYELTLLYTCDP